MNTLRPTLRTLVKAAVGAEEVIFADQNSPRPSLPYWTIRIQSQRKVGEDYKEGKVDVSANQNVKGVREATLRVERMGADSDLACGNLRDTLAKQSIADTWTVAKIALYRIGDVVNMPYKLDNSQLEPRANLDLFIRFGTNLVDNVGEIATVETEVKFDSKPDLTETVSVVL